MTRKKANIITITASIIIGVLTWMYLTHKVGWYISRFSIGVSILGICVLAFWLYSFAYLLWISNLTDKEHKKDDSLKE